MLDRILRVTGAAVKVAEGAAAVGGAGAGIVSAARAEVVTPIQPEEAGLPPLLVLASRGARLLGAVHQHAAAAGAATADARNSVRAAVSSDKPDTEEAPPPKPQRKRSVNII